MGAANEVLRERHQAGAASQRRLSRELRQHESPPTDESGQFALAQGAGRPGASLEIPASRVARLGTMGMETFGRSADILGLRCRNWRWRSSRDAPSLPGRPARVRCPQKAQVLPPRHSWRLAHAVPMTAAKMPAACWNALVWVGRDRVGGSRRTPASHFNLSRYGPLQRSFPSFVSARPQALSNAPIPSRLALARLLGFRVSRALIRPIRVGVRGPSRSLAGLERGQRAACRDRLLAVRAAIHPGNPRLRNPSEGSGSLGGQRVCTILDVQARLARSRGFHDWDEPCGDATIRVSSSRIMRILGASGFLGRGSGKKIDSYRRAY